MPLPSPKARVPPKVTNIFDICFIYITSFIVVITPPFKTFTPPNMYMFLTPPIRRCFFVRFYISEGRSSVAHCLFFYHHPSVGFADSSPLWEPYKTPLLEERWHAVTEWWQKITSIYRPFSHSANP